MITGSSGDLVWADDNRTLFYVENDPETLLTKRVKKHVLGTPVADDVLVYEEPDDSFYMGIDRSRDDKYICIGVSSTVSDEMRCAPAADPKAFTVFAPRERDVEYSADHLDGRWVIRTNAGGAKNFKLMTAPSDATSRTEWKDWIAHRDDVFIEGFELFDGFTAIGERSDGLERVRVLREGGEEYVKADEPAYSMGLDVNSEPDTQWLRYSYTSLTTPATTYELNTKTGERRLLKRQPVLGGFDGVGLGGGEVERALTCLDARSLLPTAEGETWWTATLEDSAAHTVGVSKDLREGVRSSIEILANEVVRRRAARGLEPLPQERAQDLALPYLLQYLLQWSACHSSHI